MTEDWRAVPGWEGIYEVSDRGKVRSLPRAARGGFSGTRRIKGRTLRPVKTRSGHLGISMTDGTRKERVLVHRLVMSTFVGPCPAGKEVCHNNGIPDDNRLENLRYGTRSENIYDAVEHRAHWQSKKTHCPRGHDLSGRNVKKSGNGRECLACSRAFGYVRYHEDRKPDLKIISDGYYQKIMEE